MKVKMNEIGGNILDIIQFAHRNNKDQYNFSIQFDADGAKPTAYFSTTSFEIMDAIAAEWPDAQIENIVKNKSSQDAYYESLSVDELKARF